MKKTFFIISIGLNIVLGSSILYRQSPGRGTKKETEYIDQYDVRSISNFKSIYVRKDDSTYHLLWSKAFEDEPEMAYIIATSYYYTSPNEKVLNDIRISREQLRDIYYDSAVQTPNQGIEKH